MAEDRSYENKRKEFHLSDELANILKAKYRVKAKDKNREWSVVVYNWDPEESNEGDADATMHYVLVPLAPTKDPTNTMDDETRVRMSQRVADCVAFCNKKDYCTVDKI